MPCSTPSAISPHPYKDGDNTGNPFFSGLAPWLSSRALYLITAFLPISGCFCSALRFLFQRVTLPVEFNASARAVRALEAQGILTSDELEGAKKVLSAAALTYVAALLVFADELFAPFADSVRARAGKPVMPADARRLAVRRCCASTGTPAIPEPCSTGF